MAKLLGVALFDKINSNYVAFTFCNTKAEYIRSNVESAIQVYKNLNDLTPTVLCSYDSETGEIIPCKEEFKFDEYKMPMTKADALAPLGVDFAHEALEFQQWKEERAKKLSNKGE